VGGTKETKSTRPSSSETTPLYTDAATLEHLLSGALPSGPERLELRREVGRGGMGSVFLAIDRSLRRPVAIKQLDDVHARQIQQVASFLREARVTAQIDHPNLVPIYEVGIREGHRIYYAMKLIEGEDLATRVRAKPVEERSRNELLDQIDAVIRICGAVAAAHDRGYAHCDIKPQNIMLGRHGATYLIDWGLVRPIGCKNDTRSVASLEAEQVAGDEPDWIRDAEFLAGGSPAFLSPEQALREPVTAQTDVFALGAVIYFILMGGGPFAGSSHDESIRRAAACDFQRPSLLRDGIPPMLEAIVLRAMAKRPEDRYGSVEMLAAELTRYVRSGGWEFGTLRVPAGEVIVRQGDPGETAFIILEGRCEATREDCGETRVLRIMEAGEVFGEAAILAGTCRTATVRALTDVVLHSIAAQMIEREIGHWNPWVARFVQTLARRLGEGS
jgi:serine/threonine-protein kinase